MSSESGADVAPSGRLSEASGLIQGVKTGKRLPMRESIAARSKDAQPGTNVPRLLPPVLFGLKLEVEDACYQVTSKTYIDNVHRNTPYQ